MTRRTTAVLALVLALPLPAFAQAGGGNPRAPVEKEAQAWQNAYNAGDAAAVAALYTTDAKLMVPGRESGADASAIQKLIAAEIAQGFKLALTTEDVVSSGDYAIETGTWVATSAGGKHLDHGPYVTVYQKAGGSWKISRDIWNSSMPRK